MVPWRTHAPDRHGFDPVEREPGASIAVCVAEPETRGTILARSADPTRYRAIRPNYANPVIWHYTNVSGLSTHRAGSLSSS